MSVRGTDFGFFNEMSAICLTIFMLSPLHLVDHKFNMNIRTRYMLRKQFISMTGYVERLDRY